MGRSVFYVRDDGAGLIRAMPTGCLGRFSGCTG